MLYHAFNPSIAKEHAVKVNAPIPGKGFLLVRLSAIKMKLPLKLLDYNTHLVSAIFKVYKLASEALFKPSVLLPVGTLDFDALSKLSHHLGHSVCGKKAASRCSQCQPLWYCGSGALHRELRSTYLC